MDHRLTPNKNSVRSILTDLPEWDRSTVPTPLTGSYPLKVTYVQLDDCSQIGSLETCHILASMTYGNSTSQAVLGKGLNVQVNLPHLTQPPVVEIWETSASVLRDQFQDIRLAVSNGIVFGCLETRESPGCVLEDVAREAYEQIFEYCTRSGFSHLLRMWNYFPDINADHHGLERYKRFCMGRHQAFSEQYQDFWPRLPAASAVGTSSGPFQLLFLAGSQPGIPVENPRQVSAYVYPEMYGPKSPSFARATLCHTLSGSHLFVSGTASIVGHATQHHGDPAQQTLETLCNIEAILNRVRDESPELRDDELTHGVLKVFVRNLEDVPAVMQVLERHEFGQSPVVYVQADMCRKELLVEIEGTWSQTS